MNGVWQRAWRSISPGGIIAATLALLALAVIAPFAWRTVLAWLMPAPSAYVAKDDSKDNAARYAAAFDPYVKQLDGRSLFYEPSAPGSQGEVAEAPTEETRPDDPAPTRYDGPSISAVVLGTVWFNDGQRIKVGDSKSGDLQVLSTNTPWDVRVKWRGTEFTVPFFDRDKVIFKDKPATSSSLAPLAPTEPPPHSSTEPKPTEPTTPPAPAQPAPTETPQ